MLYEILDPNAGRRTYVPIAKISPYLVAATIATEDKGFYDHPGFDVIRHRRGLSGRTTRPARPFRALRPSPSSWRAALLFTPEERSEQTYKRKLREAILAAEITRRYSKDEILELYLNEIYYGNLAYGVEAASETYFGASAEKLDLAQASFLAGLPQAPAVYDVYTNRKPLLHRQKDVLALDVRGQPGAELHLCQQLAARRSASTPVAVTQAAQELRRLTSSTRRMSRSATRIGSITSARSSKRSTTRRPSTAPVSPSTPRSTPSCRTTPRPAGEPAGGQDEGSERRSGALVAIQPATGEILAMVGSADFYNEAISGQVNMAVSPRQPGSSIKPLTYLAAFEKGWTPATLIWDVPSEFPPSGRPDDLRPPYIPANYDGAFHGPVTARFALANSYNIPAVKTLQFVGIYDDPSTPGEDGLIAFARRMGITTLTRPDYGLSLTLGGGEVSLLELTGAYSIIANRGMRLPLIAITKITDYPGHGDVRAPAPAGRAGCAPRAWLT